MKQQQQQQQSHQRRREEGKVRIAASELATSGTSASVFALFGIPRDVCVGSAPRPPHDD